MVLLGREGREIEGKEGLVQEKVRRPRTVRKHRGTIVRSLYFPLRLVNRRCKFHDVKDWLVGWHVRARINGGRVLAEREDAATLFCPTILESLSCHARPVEASP